MSEQLVKYEADEAQLSLVRRNYAADASPQEFELFMNVAQSLDLDPRQGQIYAITRNIKQKDGSYKKQTQIQVGVHGLRVLCQRGGRYESTGPVEYCGMDGVWKDVWLSDTAPAAARVRVFAKGDTRGTVGQALYREFAQERNTLWLTMPAHMLGLAAERHALRRGFQHDIGAALRTLEQHGIQVEDVSLDADEPEQAALPEPEQAALPASSTLSAQTRQTSTPPATKSRFEGRTPDQRWKRFLTVLEAELNLRPATLKEHLQDLDAREYARMRYTHDQGYHLDALFHDIERLVYDGVPLPRPDREPVLEPEQTEPDAF